jgi:acyl carrier protein
MDPEISRVRASLIEFVVRSFNVTEGEIQLDESLVDQGIVDSFGLVELTAFIEKEHGIVVRQEDMTREAFGSVNKMARFVVARLAAAR